MDIAKAVSLIEFLAKSFQSVNQKTVLHASMCLFNQLLCWEGESKSPLIDGLKESLKSIDTCLGNKELKEIETIKALLLCECRILYLNHEICTWVEEQFRLFFSETHNDLAKRMVDQSIRGAIADLM